MIQKLAAYLRCCQPHPPFPGPILSRVGRLCAATFFALMLSVTAASAQISFSLSGPQTIVGGSSLTITATTVPGIDSNSLAHLWSIEGNPDGITGVTLSGERTASLNLSVSSDFVGMVLFRPVLIIDGFSTSPFERRFSAPLLTATGGNSVPVITGTPETTVDQGVEYSFMPVGADDDGDTLTYSINGRPSWATFDPVTGRLSGTPGNDDIGITLGILISVSDGSLSAALPAFDLTVVSAPFSVADAGPNLFDVSEGVDVTLNGSNSSDSEGRDLIYSWAQVSNGAPTVDLTGADTAMPTFTAPDQLLFDLSQDRGRALVFSLTVTDETGLSSQPVTVSISVEAGADQSNVMAGTMVTLDGSGSSDPEGETLDYLWAQSGGMPRVILSDVLAVNPTFTMPVVGDGEALEFTLFVLDSVNSAQDTVRIYGAIPIADAGSDQTVAEGATVILDGSGSSDPEGGTLDYLWAQSGGSPVVDLTRADTASPAFTAPAQLLADAELEFSLVVTGGGGLLSVVDTVTITVTAMNNAPTADAGSDQNVAVGATVTLDGSGSSDPEGATLDYLWAQSGGMPRVILSDVLAVNPTFTMPVVGDGEALEFTLFVLDSVNSAQDTVVIRPDLAPVFDDLLTDQIYIIGTAITNLILPVATGGNDALTYTLTPELPAGLVFDATTRQLSGTPTATASTDYTYTVSDADRDSDSRIFNISVRTSNDPPTGGVTISGALTQGETLTADTTGIMDADGLGLFSYQWQADDAGISGATSATYTLTQAEVVSYTDSGGTTESVESVATAAVTSESVTGSISVDGTERRVIVATSEDDITDGLAIESFSVTPVGNVITFEEDLGNVDFISENIDSAALLIGSAVDISVNSSACSETKPCKVTLSYTDQDLVELENIAADQLAIFHYIDSQWEELEVIRRDQSGKTITAKTSSFSPFALGAVILNATNARFADLNTVILPEVARAIADQTVSAITQRIDQARSGGSARSVTIAGQSTLTGAASAHGQAIADGTLSLKDVLGNSDFVLPLDNVDGMGSGVLSSLTFWGGGGYRNFEGSSGGAVDFDGDLFSAHLGLDARPRDDLLIGLAASWSQSDLDYRGGLDLNGEHKLDITSIHPYANWEALTGQLDLWVTCGLRLG